MKVPVPSCQGVPFRRQLHPRQPFISPADPRSYSTHAIILSAIGDWAPGPESTWCSAVAPWQSKTMDLWIDGRLDGWLDGNTTTFSVVQLCLYTILIKTNNSDVFEQNINNPPPPHSPPPDPCVVGACTSDPAIQSTRCHPLSSNQQAHAV